jgi:hypothetical protein
MLNKHKMEKPSATNTSHPNKMLPKPTQIAQIKDKQTLIVTHENLTQHMLQQAKPF